MGALGLVVMLAGTAMSAVGAHEEGQAAKRAAAYNARAASAEAASQTARIHEVASRVRAENVTRIAKSGVEMRGSPLEVLAYNAKQAKREADSIHRSTQAYNNIQHKIGQSAVTAARWNIAGSVLRGAGSAIQGSGYTFAGGTTQAAGAGGGMYSPNFRWNDLSGLRRPGT